MFALDKGHLMFGPEAGWGESGGVRKTPPAVRTHVSYLKLVPQKSLFRETVLISSRSGGAHTYNFLLVGREL
jgi:hypothetical protein